MQILQLVNIVVILAVFCWASYKDFKTRTIEFETWYPIILVGSVVTLFSVPDLPHLIMLCIVAAGFYTLGYYHVIGGADSWAFIFIYAFLIVPLKLPFIAYFSIILQAAIIGMITILLIRVWKKRWARIPFIPALTASMVYLLLFGVPLV
jgi:hypothetical protein